MATAASLVTIQNGSPSAFGKGSATVQEGLFPASGTSCTFPVGNLSAADLVEVVPVQAVTGNIGYTYDRAGSTNSNAGQGLVNVKQVDGGSGPAATTLLQVRVYRNT